MTGSALRAPALALLLVCALLLPAATARASTAPEASVGGADIAPVMLVVDTSGSMSEDDGTGQPKMAGARAALLDVLALLPVDSVLGLRAYPEATGGCDAGRLTIPPAPRDPVTMAADIRALTPDGDTPTAEALEAAADDLEAAGYEAGTIVLVSDGLSTCEDPCDVARSLAGRGIDVTVNTVGFRIDAEGAEELACVAQAAGGVYADVSDSDELATVLSALNGPALDIDLDVAPVWEPSLSSSLSIDLRVRATLGSAARDVRASLVFDPFAGGGAPTVLRPVRLLGNLDDSRTAQVRWDAYPSIVADRGELSLSVMITAKGMPPEIRRATVRIGGALNVSAGGEVLREAQHVVVLGDSYSSGEGAGAAAGGDAYTQGGCHRTTNTYASQLYAGTSARVHNIACSGAVVSDFRGRQTGRDVAPQRDQLLRLGAGTDLVLLTMGGNDVEFSHVVVNCMTGRGCNPPLLCNGVAGALEQCEDGQRAAPRLWTRLLADLQVNLVDFYGDLRGTLTKAGSDAPIVVLPYLELLPPLALVCGSMPGVTAGELQLARWLQRSLNTVIENAVATAREMDGDLHFSDDVEQAIQPDHALCGDDPWVNGVVPDVFAKQTQELVHPRVEGYRAVAASVLRWSRTATDPRREQTPSLDVRSNAEKIWDGGVDLLDRAARGTVRTVHGWFSDEEIDFGEQQGGSVTQGRQVRVRAPGYAPGEHVLLGVASTARALGTAYADPRGVAIFDVEVPEALPSGEHTVFAWGSDAQGRLLVDGRRLEVGAGGGLHAAVVVVVLAGLLVPAALLSRAAARRRGQPARDAAVDVPVP